MNTANKELQLLTLAENAWNIGDLNRAKKILFQALELNELHSRANELMAYIVGNEGDIDSAIQFLIKATAALSCNPSALYELGGLYFQKKKYQEAIMAYERSISCGGEFFEVLHDLALTKGIVGDLKGAVVTMGHAIQVNPKSEEAHYNLGRIFDELKLFDDAMKAYQSALSCNPNFLEALVNLGIALYELNRPEEALICYEKALKIEPNFTAALLNKGMAFHMLNQYTQALEVYEQALDLDPSFEDARWNKSLIDLTLGNYKEGWQNYESRFKAVISNRRRFVEIPLLNSLEKIQGSKILVWCEQGYGDSLQFCRYLPMVKELGAEITFLVQKPLQKIMYSMGCCSVVVDETSLGEVDFQIPLLSLPKLFDTNLLNIPGDTPYLKVSRDLINEAAKWIKKGNEKKLKIGLACSGSSTHHNDSRRSIPLSFFLPLLERGDVYLIQKDLNPSDVKVLQDHPEIFYCGDLIDNFEDSAALIKNMDFIVSVDTSLAHLSGALNQKTFVCLPFSSEWRWLGGGGKSPWYPNSNLIRQSAPGNWASVVEELLYQIQLMELD